MKIFALSLVFLFGFSSCVSLPQDVKIAPIVKEKEPKKETKKEQEKEEKVEKESEEKTKS